MGDATDEVSVQVGENSLEMDATSKLIFGPICVAVGGNFFPEREWTDFVAATLASWTSEVTKLLADPTHIAECHFQDGPFWFELANAGSGKWRLVGYERSRTEDRREIIAAIVSAQTMIAQLAAALHRVVTACRRSKWNTPEIQTLARSILSLGPRTLH